MQTLLLPAVARPSPCNLLPNFTKGPLSFRGTHTVYISPCGSLYNPSPPPPPCVSSFSLTSPNARRKLIAFPLFASSSPASTGFTPPPDDSEQQAKLAQVAKRLASTARYFKRFGSFGFWGQLVCTVVSAVILSFSIVITGKITSPFSFYANAAGITASFISVFWSFGYLRLSEKLRRTANEPSKAPPRADVVKSLKNGIVVNLLGMFAAILGMQATVGLLVAKALTSSANPYYQGISPGYSPVLALDVFLVQASANTILSHFLGLVSSLELLRSVTLSPPQPVPLPRTA
ncbi:Protein TIC 21, chloroplastic [Dionaea muscipula]